MRPNFTYAAVALMSATVMAFALPAHAACKRFGFTVNDYGKEGPTNDAKELLDKHVAEWATQNGITDFKVGKKSVTCELFLDFVVFDEYTCTAKANVCWGGGTSDSSDLIQEADVETPPAPVRKVAGGAAASEESVEAVETVTQEKAVTLSTAATGAGSQAVVATTTTTSEVVDSAVLTFREAAAGSGPPPAKVALEAMTMAKRSEAAPAEQKSPERAPSSATVETGALAGDKAELPSTPTVAPAEEIVEVESETMTITTAPVDDAASKAATAAAAAAERAAAAAERAAAAAKEAAAAALAAREATQKPAMVPALTPPPTGGADRLP